MYIYYDETDFEGFVFKFMIKKEVQYSKTVWIMYRLNAMTKHTCGFCGLDKTGGCQSELMNLVFWWNFKIKWNDVSHLTEQSDSCVDWQPTQTTSKQLAMAWTEPNDGWALRCSN